jgi:glycerol-3-phosphate acyltransferase PlsY
MNPFRRRPHPNPLLATPNFATLAVNEAGIAMTIFLLIAVGYLLGSIPFGVILTRIFGAGDLRQIGSGNIGATNVLRTGRKGLAAATLVLDGAKGAVAVLLARHFLPELGDQGAMIAGGAAVIGHCYPVWLKFRGGKGVATLLGLALALAWPIGLVFAVVWLGTVLLLRISSLGGMLGAASAPIAALALGHPVYAIGLAGLAVVVLWRHRENIARLRTRTEPRIGGKKDLPDEVGGA